MTRFIRAHWLLFVACVPTAAAIIANLNGALIVDAFAAIGLGPLGASITELFKRLTEGLVVLLLLALYVERRPFKLIERRLHALRPDYITFLAGRLQLDGILGIRAGNRLRNLPELILPDVMPVLDATIEIQLEDASTAGTNNSPTTSDAPVSNPDTYFYNYTGTFAIQQTEYVIAIVNSKGNEDRLRDGGARVHDVLVVAESNPLTQTNLNRIVHDYQISLRYLADERATRYAAVQLQRISDSTTIWKPVTNEDRFPLLLLRATFPKSFSDQPRAVEFKYRLPLSKAEGFCFWAAARPMYVQTIAIDATGLTGVERLKFERFIPNFDRTATTDTVREPRYRVRVENWLLKAHGVILTWHPVQDSDAPSEEHQSVH